MKTGGDEGTMTVEALVGAAAPWWSNIMVRGSTLYEAAMMDTSRLIKYTAFPRGPPVDLAIS